MGAGRASSGTQQPCRGAFLKRPTRHAADARREAKRAADAHVGRESASRFVGQGGEAESARRSSERIRQSAGWVTPQWASGSVSARLSC